MISYLTGKGIVQNQFYEKSSLKKQDTSKENVINQLYTISEFHKRARGYSDYIGNRVEDKRGRQVEQYKIYLKKLFREYEIIKKKTSHNKFEQLLTQYGNDYLDRARKSIDIIESNGYIQLIKRSMDRNEICLGNTYFDNIRKSDTLEVRDISKCSYDLVEIDGAYFLSKLMKKGIYLDYEELIKKFCQFEELDSRSENFIKAFISYPYEFMKYSVKYTKKSEENYDEKIISKLEKAILCDSNSLV